jgi:hypothetical protein
MRGLSEYLLSTLCGSQQGFRTKPLAAFASQLRIGVDLAKNYFQVHALASEGSPAVKRKLTRSKMHRFFSQIEPSFIGMEACGSAHYWARELKAMGHESPSRSH